MGKQLEDGDFGTQEADRIMRWLKGEREQTRPRMALNRTVAYLLVAADDAGSVAEREAILNLHAHALAVLNSLTEDPPCTT